MENNGNFSFTYSAQQRSEVEAIRNKYLPGEEDKMAQLRRLHGHPTRKAQSASLMVGIIGALILGTGMSLCMTDLASLLGINGLLVGIPIGLGGMILVALAWPVYNATLKKQRRKIAPEILRLSEELLK